MGRARAELEVKRSRFIAVLERAPDEATARAVVEAVRAEFPDARHHCSAFVVSSPGQHDLEHSSDDGEPSGTAGRPMLDVLRGQGLGQVCVVVVRYFGGVLLGTGGLVRAYTDAVRAVMAGLEVAEVEHRHLLTVAADHADAAMVDSLVSSATSDALVVDRQYSAEGAVLTLAVQDPQAVGDEVARATSGRARVQARGMIDVEIPAGRLATSRLAV